MAPPVRETHVPPSSQELSARVDALEMALAESLARTARLIAVEEVKRLQNVYAYYMDVLMYDEIPPLFARDAEVRFMGGIYRGTAGVERLFLANLGGRFTGGRNGPVYGRLGEHLMLQEVVTVAPDGQSAKARLRHLLKAGMHQSARPPADESGPQGGVSLGQWIEGGYYENEYVVEDGSWKFSHLDYQLQYFATVEHGWAYSPADYRPWFRTTFPDDPIGPDALIEPAPVVWPDAVAVPFHYPNPVTGAWAPIPPTQRL